MELIPCNLISGTREADLEAAGLDRVFADGLSVANDADIDGSMVIGNQLDDNVRFGAVWAIANGTMRTNTGEGNRYGIGVYAGTVDIDDSNDVGGLEPAPSAPPATARTGLGATP